MKIRMKYENLRHRHQKLDLNIKEKSRYFSPINTMQVGESPKKVDFQLSAITVMA